MAQILGLSPSSVSLCALCLCGAKQVITTEVTLVSQFVCAVCFPLLVWIQVVTGCQTDEVISKEMHKVSSFYLEKVEELDVRAAPYSHCRAD